MVARRLGYFGADARELVPLPQVSVYTVWMTCRPLSRTSFKVGEGGNPVI